MFQATLASVNSVELTDGVFAEVHSAIVTKIKEQGDELTTLMKNLRTLLNSVVNFIVLSLRKYGLQRHIEPSFE